MKTRAGEPTSDAMRGEWWLRTMASALYFALIFALGVTNAGAQRTRLALGRNPAIARTAGRTPFRPKTENSSPSLHRFPTSQELQLIDQTFSAALSSRDVAPFTVFGLLISTSRSITR